MAAPKAQTGERPAPKGGGAGAELEKELVAREPARVTVIPEESKTLLAWRSPARPFKKRDREYYTTAGAIVFLLGVILLFLKEWLLIAVMIALAFVSYVLASVPPQVVEHEITNKGIRTNKQLYPWGWLGRFWFSKKLGETLLNVEVGVLPGRLAMVVRGYNKEKIKKVLGKYLVFDKPEDTWADKAAKWLQKKIPLET